ncbi:MAG: ATP-binding protein [Dehalococcoidia bacterium]|nr:ATP-binding protein [Dehalococcoidia bacterium]
MSIRTKILTLILAAVLLTGVSGTLIGRTVAANGLEDEAKSNLEGIAQARTHAIQNMLSYQMQSIELLVTQYESYDSMVNSGAFGGAIKADDYTAMGAILQTMTSSNKYIWQILFLDRDGTVVSSSFKDTNSSAPVLKDASSIDWSTADYSQIDWNAIDLSTVDWSRVDWSKIDFSKVDLSKLDFTKIDLGKIDMSKIDMSVIDLDELNWSTIDVGRLKFQQSDLSQTDVYIKGKEGPYIGNLLTYDNSTSFILVVAAPFYSGGQLKGVMAYLGGEDELKAISADTSGLGDTGEMYLVDENGYMLTPSRFSEDAVLQQQVTLPENMAQGGVDANVECTSWKNYTGSKVFGVYQRLPDTGWTVVVEKSKSEVFAPVSDLTRNMIWSLLVLVCCWAVLAMLLSKRLSMPIVRLKLGAERIMQGDWGYDVSTSRKDEVGDLSRSFSAMSANLKKSHDELKEYSSGLEAKVKERTAELSTANQELSREISERKQAEMALEEARNDLEIRVYERTQELQEAIDLFRKEVEERTLAEQEKEKLNQRLQGKNKELEQIVYVSSHDLRSPLVNIQGFSKEMDICVEELVTLLKNEDIPAQTREKLAPIVQTDIPDCLSYIRASVVKMDSLLSGLLRLSRLGRAALNIEDADMNQVMSDIKKTFEYRLEQFGARMEIEDLPPCRGDTTLLNQVFSNLIDNAIKYKDPGRPCLVKITGNEMDGSATYIVEDNGIGIPESQQPKVFELFHRLNPSGGISGEGLGLTIIAKVLDRLGGNVRLQSEVGSGSRFIITLPGVNHKEKVSAK